MAGHSNTKGNLGLLKTHYNKNKALGEKAQAFEFEMNVTGYPDWTVLCRSTQIPAMGRSDVEDYGAMGLLFVQSGALENSGEITVMCVETIKGVMINDLRNIIKEKKMVDITIALKSESAGTGKGQLMQLLDCKMRCDAIELSTEDTAALVKPSITIRYNFLDL
ncbi:MAG: hypothetical protein ACRCZA_13855 [Shewanella sp.]|uniref:hypothetical protein n=1 Tax=Shewanella sp. TaxID=50422 RepID=UPI003F337FD7